MMGGPSEGPCTYHSSSWTRSGTRLREPRTPCTVPLIHALRLLWASSREPLSPGTRRTSASAPVQGKNSFAQHPKGARHNPPGSQSARQSAAPGRHSGRRLMRDSFARGVPAFPDSITPSSVSSVSSALPDSLLALWVKAALTPPPDTFQILLFVPFGFRCFHGITRRPSIFRVVGPRRRLALVALALGSLPDAPAALALAIALAIASARV